MFPFAKPLCTLTHLLLQQFFYKIPLVPVTILETFPVTPQIRSGLPIGEVKFSSLWNTEILSWKVFNICFPFVRISVWIL